MKDFFNYIKKKKIYLFNNNLKISEKYNSNNVLFLLLKVWQKLSKKRHIQSYFLVLLMIFSGLLEFLSLASLLPFLEAISNSENLLKNKYIYYFYNIFGYTSQNQIIILTTLIFLFIIYFSAIFRALNLLFNVRLIAAIGTELSTEGYRRALYQPYKKHLNWNSSIIISTIAKDTKFAVSGLSSFLVILNSSIIIFSIFIGIFLVNAIVAISLIILFGICYLLIGYSNKKQIEKNSYTITKKSQAKIQSLQ